MADSTPSQAINDVMYLASCAVQETVPDAERVCRMNLDEVYREAQRQLLAGCCAFALESLDICIDAFVKAKNKAVRKVVLLDIQRARILERLESAGIWYMPLKGAVLKDHYPTIGMREMSDNDILFDASRTKDMRAIMIGEGFEAKRYEKGAHDIFYKKPIYNFEMHRLLFTSEYEANLATYYRDVFGRLLPDENKRYGYHFSPEDFYLFMVAHEYKHYSGGGTGLRGCLDTYVYLTRNALDMDYVRAEAEKMGISDFERANRALSLQLIGGAGLSEDEFGMFDYMYRSGVYGNVGVHVEHKVKNFGGGMVGRARYILRRSWISMESVKSGYPFFYRHKILLPLVPFVRFGKMLTTNRRKVAKELRALFMD